MKWIPLTIAIPKIGEYILGTNKEETQLERKYFLARYDGKDEKDVADFTVVHMSRGHRDYPKFITHWMPLLDSREKDHSYASKEQIPVKILKREELLDLDD